MLNTQFPCFSIIIPIYNTEKELSRCLDSILNQEYPNYEIILVDDGSRDRSGELCDQYARKNKQIKVVHQENAGCSAARNAGVNVAKGDFLIFVDSDDMWEGTEGLSKLAQTAMENENADVLLFGIRIYKEDGTPEKELQPNLPLTCSPEKGTVLRHLVYRYQYVSASYCKAISRDMFLKNDLYFVKGLLSEDIEWSARVMIASRQIAVCHVSIYKRIRRGNGSITSQIGERNIRDILASLEKGIPYAEIHAESPHLLMLYYEYWSYQYAMLLCSLSIVKDSQEYLAFIERMKKLSWLLKFHHVPKVRLVNIAYRILGIKKTVLLLGRYYNSGLRK